MDQLEYACVLFDERNPESEKFTNNFLLGEWGWKLCQDAYKTEMSLMTGLPETEFGIEKGMTVCAVSKDKRCLGFINLYISADNAPGTLCIGHAYVRPEVRSKGVYKRMVERTEKFAKDIGAKRIISFVHRSNGGSMKAHHNLGFKQSMVGYVKEVEDVQADA